MPPGLLLWALTDSNQVGGQDGVSSQGLTRRDLLPNSHGRWWDPGPCGPLVKGHSQSCHVGPSNTDISPWSKGGRESTAMSEMGAGVLRGPNCGRDNSSAHQASGSRGVGSTQALQGAETMGAA